MSPYRGPLSTLIAAGAVLILLVCLFGCGSEDLSTPPEAGVGTIEIQMPSETAGATWHLYGPGDSFDHGDTDLVTDGDEQLHLRCLYLTVVTAIDAQHSQHSVHRLDGDADASAQPLLPADLHTAVGTVRSRARHKRLPRFSHLADQAFAQLDRLRLPRFCSEGPTLSDQR